MVRWLQPLPPWFLFAIAPILAGCGTMGAALLTGYSNRPPMSTSMPDTDSSAEIPAGFVAFCLHNADQCLAVPKEPRSLDLDDSTWHLLQEVNVEVNRSIRPLDDLSHYGRPEVWTISTDGYGDCDDYTLSKRKLLIAAGISRNALRITIALSRGERHAVLTVVTDHGDYILDNMTNEIRPWKESGYVWVERQDPDRAYGWASLATSRLQ